MRERPAAYNAAMICSTLCNINRDTKKKPDPFTPDDFLPTYEKPEPPKPPPTVSQVAHKANTAFKALSKLHP